MMTRKQEITKKEFDDLVKQAAKEHDWMHQVFKTFGAWPIWPTHYRDELFRIVGYQPTTTFIAIPKGGRFA